MTAIRVTPAIAGAIHAHAAAAYPDECCGALIGSQANGHIDIVEARALKNVTDEGPRRRFRVSADDYRESEGAAVKAGADLIGFYHSHPDHPAVPSQYDLDHAWPNLSYVIVSAGPGGTGDLRSWRLRPDRSAFEEEQQL
jgi:proteasome lid subunit RPN8/RPN11